MSLDVKQIDREIVCISESIKKSQEILDALCSLRRIKVGNKPEQNGSAETDKEFVARRFKNPGARITRKRRFSRRSRRNRAKEMGLTKSILEHLKKSGPTPLGELATIFEVKPQQISVAITSARRSFVRRGRGVWGAHGNYTAVKNGNGKHAEPAVTDKERVLV